MIPVSDGQPTRTRRSMLPIRSSRWSAGCAVIAGLAVSPIWVALAALVAMGRASTLCSPYLVALFPLCIAIGVVALLSWGRNSLLAVLAGVVGFLVGLSLIFLSPSMALISAYDTVRCICGLR